MKPFSLFRFARAVLSRVLRPKGLWVLALCWSISAQAVTVLPPSFFAAAPPSEQPATTILNSRYGDFRRAMEVRALNYFLEQAHPKTGLVRDRASNFLPTPETNRIASLAATGFGLAVISNAAMRGLLHPGVAQEQVLRTLRFSRDHVSRYKGWFVHFVDWETGARVWNCEYSTIDTALFMAGAFYASQVFSQNPEIGRIVRELYLEIDFPDMMTDGKQKPFKRTLSMAYTPENGYTASQWSMYAEQMLLLVLGLGHPTRPLPLEAWRAFDRDQRSLPSGEMVMGLGEALFVHQYSQVFMDLRQLRDGFPDYAENSWRMTLHHREFARSDASYQTLRTGFWGFSAGDSPKGYRVATPLSYESTVCIGCVVGSAMLAPQLILHDLWQWQAGPYGPQIWGRYGFTDSVDLDANWFGADAIGITVGTAYLALADIEPLTSVWRDFMRIPEIRRGLERARLSGTLPPENGR